MLWLIWPWRRRRVTVNVRQPRARYTGSRRTVVRLTIVQLVLALLFFAVARTFLTEVFLGWAICWLPMFLLWPSDA